MSEQKMIAIVRTALAKQGIEDEVLAVGEFYRVGTLAAGSRVA